MMRAMSSLFVLGTALVLSSSASQLPSSAAFVTSSTSAWQSHSSSAFQPVSLPACQPARAQFGSSVPILNPRLPSRASSSASQSLSLLNAKMPWATDGAGDVWVPGVGLKGFTVRGLGIRDERVGAQVPRVETEVPRVQGAEGMRGPELLVSGLAPGTGSEADIAKIQERLAEVLNAGQDRLYDERVPEASKPMTERVKVTVNTLYRRRTMFEQYANDIQGLTGLGAFAALTYVQKVIQKRQPVWGDLLMIVMQSRPIEVEVSLTRAARETLSAPIDTEEWIWFRDNLLSTYVWFSQSRMPGFEHQKAHLYERLVDIAQEKIKEQALLADALRFPELEDVPSAAFIPGGINELRQDHRTVGNFAAIKPQLLGSTENVQFYDLNVYLNQLLCISKVVDSQFQDYMHSVFAPMKDEIVFESGPPKNLARSRAKAQTDYVDCAWPTTAHLVDLIRCSITFDSAADLKRGLGMLLRSAGMKSGVKEDGSVILQEDCWDPESKITVARIKNGFSSGKKGYRDIKVNVIFRSDQGFAMIGEVALVLAKLRDYKEATHELYEILRERDFFSQVVDEMQLHHPEAQDLV